MFVPDPDITANDGVYSSYFVLYIGNGQYDVTAKVSRADMNMFAINGSSSPVFDTPASKGG